MPVRTLVIANPKSRNRATLRRRAALETKLRDALGPLDVEWTHGPRDAERIAREGARSGIERVIVAGGDGTLSEVVTGLLSAQLGDRVAIGLLPFGTGSDFPRGLGHLPSLDAAIDRLAAGKATRIDAGRIRYRSDEGRDVTRYFANIASFGLSGDVAELVNRSTKILGGRLSYMVGALRAIARHRSEPVSISVDGERVFDGRLSAAAVANGSTFGGGMRVAPNARIDDGLFDWVILPAMSRSALLKTLYRVYSGSHIRDPKVLNGRGRVIEANGAIGSIRLDVDGESMGVLPAHFENLPGAIALIGYGE